MVNAFESIDTLYKEIKDRGYIVDKSLVTSIYLAYCMNKPLLLEGPAGVGKTEVANIIADIIGHKEPIRLQCYEGIDDSKSLYEWNYKKQLLYIQTNKNEDFSWKSSYKDIYSEDFLSVRPVLKSILSSEKQILLIDEIDKSDEEFEPLLLEFLSAFQVSIPEIGTIKSKSIPFVILTSNNMRDLSDAMLRRCAYFYIDYPTPQREAEIILHKFPHISNILTTQIVYFVEKLRKLNLKKVPSISETIDWAQALLILNKDSLDVNVVEDTLNFLLKSQKDIDFNIPNIKGFINDLPKKPLNIQIDRSSKKHSTYKDNGEIKEIQDWDF